MSLVKVVLNSLAITFMLVVAIKCENGVPQSRVKRVLPFLPSSGLGVRSN